MSDYSEMAEEWKKVEAELAAVRGGLNAWNKELLLRQDRMLQNEIDLREEAKRLRSGLTSSRQTGFWMATMFFVLAIVAATIIFTLLGAGSAQSATTDFIAYASVGFIGAWGWGVFTS
tara:strand:+ start:270 stop:623 length:354 start_codon:yes stop_codon:yes gene_type:complete